MSESNSAARVLVVLLLGALVALFVALAVDMAVPAPADPWAQMSEQSASATQTAGFSVRRDEIQAELDAKAITQAEADVRLAALDEEEMLAFDSAQPSEAAMAEFNKIIERRGLVQGGIAAGLVTLLLALALVMARRGIALAEVPLLAGAFLGIYGFGVSSLGSGLQWSGVGITGLIAVLVIAAGLRLFTRPADTPQG